VPGAEADRFCEVLTLDLLNIVDERTGKPVVRRVQRAADHFEGEHVDALPDLLVHWSDSLPIGSTSIAGGVAAEVRVRSPKIGVVEGVNEYGRTGEHRVEGMFVAAGPGFRPARLESGVFVLDFAPTIAAALDVELPDADGRPIPELVPKRVQPEGEP
jgi:predicted AlkP superfamily phosphohydrolase/phosphomutase